MEENIEKYHILNRAMHYCSHSEHCAFDVIQKLKQWNAPDKYYEWIINQLVQENFLDDYRYALSFTNDKFRFNKWGKIKISCALRQKEIGDDIIKQATGQIETGLYNGTAYQLLKSKAASMNSGDKKAFKARLFRFMAQRGFEFDVIQNAWQKLNSTL